MSEDISCGPGKVVTLFQKGQIIVLHQEKKTTKDVDETAKIGLRTVQHIKKKKIKIPQNWRKSVMVKVRRCYDQGGYSVSQVSVLQRYVPKNEAIWLPAYTLYKFFHQWIFSSLMARAYSKMAQTVTEWFGKTSSSHMDWSPQSLDLNLPENLWNLLEKFLRSSLTLP